MANQKSKVTAKKVAVKTYKGRVDYSLRADDKKKIKALAEKVDVATIIQQMAERDIKTSFRWDYDNDCIRCDFYRAFTGYPDSGYMFTSRHSDLVVCVAIGEYVLGHVFDWQMPVGDNRDTDW